MGSSHDDHHVLVVSGHKYQNLSDSEKLHHVENAGEGTNHLMQVSLTSQRQEETIAEHDHDHDQVFFAELSALRSFLLLIALTFHSLFEGLAIGLQQESWMLLQIFIAVIVHKAIMAFSLGLNLAQSAGVTVKRFIIANLIFSVSSPLGMALGILLSHLQKSLARDIANGTLQVCVIRRGLQDFLDF